MTDRTRPDPTRRRMLARLGLALGAAYAAPALMRLDTARASSGGSFSYSGPSRPRRRRAPPPRPEIVVSAPTAADIDRIAAAGFTVLSRARIDLIGAEVARFRLPAGVTPAQAPARVEQISPGSLVDLNHVYRPGSLPCGDDGCAAFQMIGWPEPGEDCAGLPAIGMVDTTVNDGHAALADVDVTRVPVLAEDRAAAGAIHGTAVAILIAGRGDSRTPGLLPRARLVVAEAFFRDARGQDAADAFDIARAVAGLVERGVGVVNLSFSGPRNLVLERVVAAALARDVILVAAAGNSGPRAEALYPAAFEGVVAVTAVDSGERAWRQAAAGEHIDFAAPGVQLWTAASVSGGRFRSGTSFAAPFVTAALAVARAREPGRPAAEIVEALAGRARDLGAPGRDPTFGWGLVQAETGCGAGVAGDGA